jgi:predicted esterase
MKPLVVFAHGKESGPWGTKIVHLAGIAEQLGYAVLSVDYRDLMDPDERVRRLLTTELPPHDTLILAGSSMGGYVSAVASVTLRPAGLFLMAPAVYMPIGEVQSPSSGAKHTCVVFGWHDEVIPVANGIRYAQETQAALHVFDSGHRLDDVLDKVGGVFEAFLREITQQP